MPSVYRDDLQNIEIIDNKLVGTVNYLDNFEYFNRVVPSKAPFSGYFIALRIDWPEDSEIGWAKIRTSPIGAFTSWIGDFRSYPDGQLWILHLDEDKIGIENIDIVVRGKTKEDKDSSDGPVIGIVSLDTSGLILLPP